MMKSRLTKVYNALGNFRYSSNPQSLGFTSNVRNERSSMVRPEPCDQSIIAPPNAEDAKYEEWLVSIKTRKLCYERFLLIIYSHVHYVHISCRLIIPRH